MPRRERGVLNFTVKTDIPSPPDNPDSVARIHSADLSDLMKSSTTILKVSAVMQTYDN
jgi:hypothetical protein